MVSNDLLTLILNKMKPLIFTLCVAFTFGGLHAQTNVWQPSPGHTQVLIWPGAVPDAEPVQRPERVTIVTNLVAGKPWAWVDNVSQPTMTVYSPKGTNTGVAVVVLPGGGYEGLAIDLEGTEFCEWLTSRGMTAVLLKYRVPTREPQGYRESRQALQDAQRTVGLVRFHAAKWQIEPHKIGVIGTSAGGHLAAALSTHFENRLYSPVDAADKQSCRPDFAIALYPGHLWETGASLPLNPNVPVTSKTPPTFLLHAENDAADNVNNSLAYYIALKNAKVHAEMHLYAEGGHAFGLRRTKFPITQWPELAERWLGTIGAFEDSEIRRLVGALSSGEWRERQQAAEALCSGGLSAKPAIPHLIEGLADEEWQVRKAAATALSRMGPLPEQAIPRLIAALADEEWHVRKPAAEALGALGPASAPAVSALIKALGDEEWQVRKAVAEALAAFGRASAPAVPALIKALRDEEWHVRKPAAEALAEIGPSGNAAVSALRNLLTDPEVKVRRAAALSIERLAERATN